MQAAFFAFKAVEFADPGRPGYRKTSHHQMSFTMPLHPQLDQKLSKLYAPSTRIDDVFKGHDITFVTNDHGEPMMLFIGKRKANGAIAGERYVRTIKRQPGSQQVASSHWDLKGKTQG
jgi:hypothetical protein